MDSVQFADIASFDSVVLAYIRGKREFIAVASDAIWSDISRIVPGMKRFSADEICTRFHNIYKERPDMFKPEELKVLKAIHEDTEYRLKYKVANIVANSILKMDRFDGKLVQAWSTILKSHDIFKILEWSEVDLETYYQRNLRNNWRLYVKQDILFKIRQKMLGYEKLLSNKNQSTSIVATKHMLSSDPLAQTPKLKTEKKKIETLSKLSPSLLRRRKIIVNEAPTLETSKRRKELSRQMLDFRQENQEIYRINDSNVHIQELQSRVWTIKRLLELKDIVKNFTLVNPLLSTIEVLKYDMDTECRHRRMLVKYEGIVQKENHNVNMIYALLACQTHPNAKLRRLASTCKAMLEVADTIPSGFQD